MTVGGLLDGGFRWQHFEIDADGRFLCLERANECLAELGESWIQSKIQLWLEFLIVCCVYAEFVFWFG